MKTNKIMRKHQDAVGATNLVARRCCVLISGDMVCRPYQSINKMDLHYFLGIT